MDRHVFQKLKSFKIGKAQKIIEIEIYFMNVLIWNQLEFLEIMPNLDDSKCNLSELKQLWQTQQIRNQLN